jgi:HEPN domain-containing protein
MTDSDIIAHWRKGARDALEMAQAAIRIEKYDHALFNCHLAVEKALKAAVMENTREPHPKIHNLGRLAELVSKEWTKEEQEMFDTLSSFAVAARYDDPPWAEQYATKTHAELWVKTTSAFISRHVS